VAFTADTCLGTTSTRPQGTRYNVNQDTTVTNGVDRYNLFAFLNQDIGGGLELFAEAGVYLADSVGYREAAPMLAAAPIVIPATNYYNPFGPIGSPNRLANTNAPAGGLALTLTSYRPIDAGPRKTEVENLSTRALVGLRGDIAGWDWESALLYTMAATEDRENRISNTLFQQQLALSTPDAYNPFNGGCVVDIAAGDCTPGNAVAIAAITVPVSRRNKTSLASWDFMLSRPISSRCGPATSAPQSASRRDARHSLMIATHARTARSTSLTSSAVSRPTICRAIRDRAIRGAIARCSRAMSSCRCRWSRKT
jgi:hypothetical protein